MSVLKGFGRSAPVQGAVGRVLAGYLRLVHRTNRFETMPADIYAALGPLQPFIGAMWHGQHLMAPFLRRPDDPAASLVSRSSDGELNAIALHHLGIRAIRGSGARGRDQRLKGGAEALRAMLRALAGGENMFLTADVPKIARLCGAGIVTLARMSGRPVVPVAVATSRSLVFSSWDRASLGLPFGRGAMVVGRPVSLDRSAGPIEMEAARIEIERELDRVHGEAFRLVGAVDPGASLRHGATRAGRPA